MTSCDGSPFGAGWWIDGIPLLVIGSTDVLMVSGQGDSRRFTGPGPNFTSPAEDFGTLAQHQDGSYTYTTKDQWLENFNSSGYLTSVVDPHGLTTSYTWNQQNQLTQVQANLAELDRFFAETDAELTSGRILTAGDIRVLTNIHGHMEDRFERHLNLVRSRKR